jgi:hypothetical protein
LQSGGITAGNVEGTIGVLLDAGTLSFRVETAGLPDGTVFPVTGAGKQGILFELWAIVWRF